MPRSDEVLTTNDVHNALHVVLESPDVLEAVNAALRERKHQAIDYGALPSGLHLHYLCHALRADSRVYVELDGTEHEVRAVRRRVDKIGRADTAIVLECAS
jgi:hypothetical protein